MPNLCWGLREVSLSRSLKNMSKMYVYPPKEGLRKLGALLLLKE
jgi:hypothetical protein